MGSQVQSLHRPPSDLQNRLDDRFSRHSLNFAASLDDRALVRACIHVGARRRGMVRCKCAM
ncbi:hypothetical protein MESS2_440022 [Mesorhizobium metallidurans STM 2683]|uniref:Uncharacterized protein n=1 Tax=Mesorhizobium metallidurans STM 2683 TaxID=1297569 RepID=M5ERJ9_9HYPH|nr:hypothetical protein MESS2_440022 [Mesorhizobium metallidurans STM 2683]